MAAKTSYTFKLTEEQQNTLEQILTTGNYRPATVPYTRIAAKGEDVGINLYTSGKCLVQGKAAEDFVLFVIEPLVLKEAGHGYERELDPSATSPHAGIDESGKGDFFGPLIIACAYTDEALSEKMQEMGVKDSKNISSDKKAMALGMSLRRLLGRSRYAIVPIGPAAYNRLYAKIKNVNRLLSWGHARSLENLLETFPGCPRAVSDQFGSKQQVKKALMAKGRDVELEQRHRAESDIAVAAASILARDAFLRYLIKMQETYGITFPKGASARVVDAAESLVKARGPSVLLETSKCHFKTTDKVLEAVGFSRADLGPEGALVSKPYNRRRKGSST